MIILESAIADLDGKQMPGDVVFKLYDTYGFPLDLTADIARERGLTIDEQGFETAMSAQRDRARAASKFASTLKLTGHAPTVKIDIKTEFLGYEGIAGVSEIHSLYRDEAAVDSLSEGEEGAVILLSTPFYAESGGQIGDSGILIAAGKLFRGADTQKSANAIVH